MYFTNLKKKKKTSVRVHNEGPAIHSICIILKYSDNGTKKEHLHDKTVISCIISCASPRKEWDVQEARGSSPKSPFDFCLELEGFVGRGALGGGGWKWGRTGNCFVLIWRDGGKNYKR